MLSTDFIFRQQENLVGNQKCQAGFRPYLYSDYTTKYYCSPESQSLLGKNTIYNN